MGRRGRTHRFPKRRPRIFNDMHQAADKSKSGTRAGATDQETAARLVGKAFRGADGLVRWITSLSTRHYYTLLWLDEQSQTWFAGGIVKVSNWEGGAEVTAPQPGERYRRAGATGLVDECTVTSELSRAPR